MKEIFMEVKKKEPGLGVEAGMFGRGDAPMGCS